jgi:amidase
VRIAWFRDLGGIPFDSRVRTIVDSQWKVFEDLGCVVEQAEPDFAGVDEAFKTLRAWSFEAQYGDRVRTDRSQFKDTILWEVDRGAKLTGPEISRAESGHSLLWAHFQAFLEKYEYFVLPVTQVPPFDVHQPFVTEIGAVRMETYIDWMKSCYYISTVGNPAISAPCGFTPEGLPVGLQIVGRHQDEWNVLQLAYAFEQATRVGRRRPVTSNK